MEQLFRLTELEVRVPLNLNVIDPLGVPRVMNLKEALQAFLDHRREVLQRRSRHRLAAVARRMEVLRGLVIVYVNLDEVIRIIREADDPKAEMMARWDLSEVQVEAILNMRLRTLRRLEEIAIQKELEALAAEEPPLTRPARQRQAAMARARQGGPGDRSRVRRRHGARPPPHPDRRRAGAGRDPGRGAGRARGGDRAVLAKGLDPRGQGARRRRRRAEIQGRRRAALCGAAETTDRLIMFGSNGRFYTIGADRLPGGRGQGEPLRLMIDLPNEHDVVALFPYRPGMRLLVAAMTGAALSSTARRRWRRPAPASRC